MLAPQPWACVILEHDKDATVNDIICLVDEKILGGMALA